MGTFRAIANNFGDVLNVIQMAESGTEKNTHIPAVYFRCVEWNHEAEIKLWFRIFDKSKMQAYRELDGQMVKLDGIHPSFHMTITDMFEKFEYIVEF